MSNGSDPTTMIVSYYGKSREVFNSWQALIKRCQAFAPSLQNLPTSNRFSLDRYSVGCVDAMAAAVAAKDGGQSVIFGSTWSINRSTVTALYQLQIRIGALGY
jgi:hypothetical protein